MVCCAVFVCTMFLNYNLDITSVKPQLTTAYQMQYYEAQVMNGQVVTIVTGGCLLLTSAIMLLFYIKHEIDRHRKELGILKALGYSNLRIARDFWIFGLHVCLGGILGFAGSYFMMPMFYQQMNRDEILPFVSFQMHMSILFYLVVIPAIAFSCIAVVYSNLSLRQPALGLLREHSTTKHRVKSKTQVNRTFLQELKHNTVFGRKTLLFFVGFACFCFSSMMQMSFSMDELSSELFAAIILSIGFILSATTIWMAISTVVHANQKNIAMMQVFGYSSKECSDAVLNGYRPISYIGFVLGTGYQYGLLKGMVTLVFQDIENVPEYHFDWAACIIVLVTFIILYELVMYLYALKIRKIPVKEIMLES